MFSFPDMTTKLSNLVRLARKNGTVQQRSLSIRTQLLSLLVATSILSSTAIGLSQDKAENESARLEEEALKLAAKVHNDKRSIEQIRKDNSFIRAAGEGDLAVVRKMLHNGALVNSFYIDVNVAFGDDASGYTALMWAVQAEHHDMVKLLIEHKADPNLTCTNPGDQGKTSLYMAVFQGTNKAIVESLVKAGAKGNPESIRLGIEMRSAACQGFKIKEGEGYPLYPGYPGTRSGATIAEMVKKGADINSPDPKGCTPLMYAANLGLVENVKLLLAHGADPSLKTSNGTTAISILSKESSCAQAERQQIAELLPRVLNERKK